MSKNGFEIRTEILRMAQELVSSEHAYKYETWSQTKIGAAPSYPSHDQIIDKANALYAFVEKSTK